MSEMRPEERAAIQNDVRRSRPIFTAAPWAREEVNHDAHNARLERVLCAWTQYDQEIGYVQAMNLVSSTLLLLLDGDEEASFWLLVQLIRQLPRSFYARAPLPLLGFWTEVEVLSQLASRLLGLDGLRTALLQVAPQWLLTFWVGALPLEAIVMVWDAMLKHGNATTPSVLPLQISLVLLRYVQPQLAALLATAKTAQSGLGSSGNGSGSTRASPTPSDNGDVSENGQTAGSLALVAAAHHQAFTLLQSIRVPDASAGWLLHQARRLRLNEAAVQDMRLQLRMAMEAQCAATQGLLLCADPLPDCGSKPLPLLLGPSPSDDDDVRLVPRSVRELCADGDALWTSCCEMSNLVSLLACLLTLIAFAGSCILWSGTLRGDTAGTDWEVSHLDTLIILGLCTVSSMVSCSWRSSLPAVALGSCLTTLFLAARATEVLLECVKITGTGASHGACRTLDSVWPVVCFGLTLLVAVLQLTSSCSRYRSRRLRSSGARMIMVGVDGSTRESIQ